MPEKAKVAVFEDDKRWSDIYRYLLEDAGHKIVVSAATRESALKAVQQFKELGVQVAIVDGNLNPNDADGADGQAVLAAIRSTAQDVKTVGVSALSVRGVDVNVGKSRIENLGEAVTNL